MTFLSKAHYYYFHGWSPKVDQSLCALSSAWPKLSGAEIEKHEWHFSSFRCDGTLIGRLRPQIGTDISLGFGCCVEMMMAFVDAHFSGFGWVKLRCVSPHQTERHVIDGLIFPLHSHPQPRKRGGLWWSQFDEISSLTLTKKILEAKHLLHPGHDDM